MLSLSGQSNTQARKNDLYEKSVICSAADSPTLIGSSRLDPHPSHLTSNVGQRFAKFSEYPQDFPERQCSGSYAMRHVPTPGVRAELHGGAAIASNSKKSHSSPALRPIH